MNKTKLITILLLSIIIFATATISTIILKPQMHKTIMLENIIFKRSK